jgi:very-short-patch-repair endonuclease
MNLIEAQEQWVPQRRHRSTSPQAKGDRARQMRHNPTPCERLLCQQLRQGQTGYKFRRQHPLFGWIADFWCAEVGLAVEVDGPIHDRYKDRDQHRDSELARYGISTLRLANEEVLTKIDACVAMIISTAEGLHSRLLPGGTA